LFQEYCLEKEKKHSMRPTIPNKTILLISNKNEIRQIGNEIIKPIFNTKKRNNFHKYGKADIVWNVNY